MKKETEQVKAGEQARIERTPEDQKQVREFIARNRATPTSGPWIAQLETDYSSAHVLDKHGRQLADIYGDGYDARNANARLIAAAPTLLEIAEAMLVVGDHIDISQGVRMRDIFFDEFKSLDAAIARAEGR